MSEHHENLPKFNHPCPNWILYAVFFALVGLTVLTVVMNELPLGKADIWVALAIATVKGSLVVLFFMHMFWEKGFNVLVFASSFLFVGLFIGMTLMDTDNYKTDIEDFKGQLPAERVAKGQ